jgi:hypothetical protein
MQNSTAPINIANPTIPLINPPTKGMYPRIVVIGEKNRQIPMTIAKYAAILKIKVYFLES